MAAEKHRPPNQETAAPRFLCDHMLQRLGRWLRAAGYDTGIDEKGVDDRVLIMFAVTENRTVISRDHKLLEIAGGPERTVLLGANDLAGCAEELTRRLRIDWLIRPFSRCLLCNAPLIDAPAKRWDEVPERSREASGPLLHCPACARLYWEGGHVRRMRARLERWRQGEFR